MTRTIPAHVTAAVRSLAASIASLQETPGARFEATVRIDDRLRSGVERMFGAEDGVVWEEPDEVPR